MNPHEINPKLDIVLDRVVGLPPELKFLAWTDPKHVVHWFTPAPWKTVACELDLRPGGKFKTTMQSPEGQSFPNEGCILEVVKDRKLVWTSAMAPGYRPRLAPVGMFLFTCVLTFEPQGKGTQYRAVALHSDEEGRQKHDKMGFVDGWGKALDQLVAHMKKI